jgi:hypothetical protein
MPGKANPPFPPGLPIDPFNPHPPGQAPIAQDDQFSIDEDSGPLNVDLLADNGAGADSDPNGDALTVTEVEIDGEVTSVGDEPLTIMASSVDGRMAQLTIQADGTATLDPLGNFNDLAWGEVDTVTFTYTISDGKFEDTAAVTVTVEGTSDYNIDALIANGPELNGDGGGTNQLLINQGGTEGDFLASELPGGVYESQALALGDVDGDGDLDAIIANFPFVSGGGDVTPGTDQLLINQGGDQGGTEGDFVASELPSDISSKDVALGDVDGDGDLDAIIVEPGHNQLLTNQGGDQGGNEGDFLASNLPSTQNQFDIAYSNHVALGDVDGDGDLDAIIANQSGPDHDGTNLLLTNQGGDQGGVEGDFLASELPGGTAFSHGVALGDVDGDGDLDAITTNVDGANQLLTNQGGAQDGTEGDFLASELPGGTAFSHGVALGDVDGDGDLDAIIANTGTSQLLINQGGAQDGTEGDFVASELPGGAHQSWSVAFADIDGDEDLDAIIANLGGGPGDANTLLTNQGGAQGGTEGDFVASELTGADASYDVAFGDVDGDGAVPAVDVFGLPNINPDGLLPDVIV